MAKKTTKKTAKTSPKSAKRTAPKAASKKPAAAQAGRPIDDPMSLSMLEQLGRLMSENDLSLVDLRDGSQRIYLRRGTAVAPAAASAPAAAPAPAATPAPAPAASAPAPSAPASTPAPAADDDAGLSKITSPMVGTFYAAPGPGKPDFVAVGTKVTADSDVCIIEAMKVFNNIKAELSGTVKKVLVESGESVEYGQPLFLVEPS